ncbi:polysaccharide deacetylase family protein [Streptomyces sp. NRRL S-87]|uniref:polysaccharide deacetylase family protein n=1 Tax=Streptomyces sp. NRRL S-87 TaxID=1463920 RepID=UPI00068F0E83|nr:polysaccharide deacetylase family protein [Streptomyces sp. NRRL S-87]
MAISRRRIRRRAHRAGLAAAVLIPGVLMCAPSYAAAGGGGEVAKPSKARPAMPPVTITRTAAGAERSVAITIDDGPDPVWTPKVLDVLDHYRVKAVFCMIGKHAQEHPDLVREVAARGHRLCDHSVGHDTAMDRKPVAYQEREIVGGKTMIEKAAPGVRVDYYRAPGGAFTPASRRIAAEHGMRPLGWSVDPRDWSRPGVPSIIESVEKLLVHRPTVLFHDGGGDRSETVAALERVLPWFAEKGYAFTFPAVDAA